ncbi:hypothetical protein Peur_040319 [Populus x canadensis]
MHESQTSIELPVFDISRTLNPSCLSSLCLACKERGFFHITNRGVSKDSKVKVGPSSRVKTYTPPFNASPFFESLRVSGPDFTASAQSSTAILPDHSNPEFSETVEEYGAKMSELSRRIVKAVLMSMRGDFAKKSKLEGLGMNTDMSCVTIACQDEIGALQVRSEEGKWMDINPCEDTLVVNINP